MFKQILVCLSVFVCGIYQNSSNSVFIIDNDAGADDSMAIFLALLYEEHFGGPKLMALTTVHGNTKEDNVYYNNQRILKVANRQDIPIYRGSKTSLVQTPDITDYFGKDGLGDSSDVFEDLVPARNESAVLALIEYSKKHEGELTVITIGSLTNVALAIKLDPGFVNRLKKLYVGAGNIQSIDYPDPQFNALMDAEAYQIVVENAAVDKVIVCPSTQVKKYLSFTKPWRLDVLGSIQTRIMKYQNRYENTSIGKEIKWQTLDPAVIALFLKPDLVEEYKYSRNNITLCGDRRGLVAHQFVDKKNAHLQVIYSIKTEEYRQFILDVFSHDGRRRDNE